MKYKVIKDLKQYNEYCEIHESLMVHEEAGRYDELELLEVLIEDYDRKVMDKKTKELNPVELLRSLLAESSISQTELANAILVSKQLVSDILSYRRKISKDIMIKLANYFSMSIEAFSRPYSLKIKESEKVKS